MVLRTDLLKVSALFLVFQNSFHWTTNAHQDGHEQELDQHDGNSNRSLKETDSGWICGTPEPDEDELRKFEEQIREKRESERNKSGSKSLSCEIISVNVYFHVIQDDTGTIGHVSKNTIEAQMDVLNKAFAGTNSANCPGAGPGTTNKSPFVFNLKEITYSQNSAWFNHNFEFPPDPNEMAMKSALRRGTCKDLNIYTWSAPSQGFARTLGYGWFPFWCSSGDPDDLTRDGVVIGYEYLPGETLDNVDIGDDLVVHEVGHWIGLYHTFHGNSCGGNGDYVVDTPPQLNSSENCPIGKDSCPGDGEVDPIHNYMDYSNKCCVYQFTPGQISRGIDVVEIHRGLECSTICQGPQWPGGSFPMATNDWNPDTSINYHKMHPCDTIYESQFTETCGIGKFQDVGDVLNFSGDLWALGTHYKIGFLQMTKFRMEDIDNKPVFLVKGAISIKDFGQIQFSGMERNLYVPFPSSAKIGDFSPMNATVPITGGTGKFQGAGGVIEFGGVLVGVNSAEKTIDVDFYFKITPKCGAVY